MLFFNFGRSVRLSGMVQGPHICHSYRVQSPEGLAQPTAPPGGDCVFSMLYEHPKTSSRMKIKIRTLPRIGILFMFFSFSRLEIITFHYSTWRPFKLGCVPLTLVILMNTQVNLSRIFCITWPHSGSSPVIIPRCIIPFEVNLAMTSHSFKVSY